MDEETIKFVLAIHKKVEQLEKVKNIINNRKSHRLSYLVTCDNPDILQYWKMEDIYTMDYIKDIFERHDKQIRREIDERINQLKRDLEEL